MSDDRRIEELLEEIMDSGRSPEEVCRACPELLPAVLEGLRRLRAFEGEVSAMFPTRGPGLDGRLSDSELPDIPGYEVKRVLGRGGMGVVFQTRHLKLMRTVAIKMLVAGGYAGAPELARFVREAQAIAGLRHPNIIQVFDVGDLRGRPYFTMEYLEGGTLSQKLAGVPQPGREAAAMVATLADAIQAAHAAGIVHRDLKPANILLTADGTPKIGDFGLARSYTEAPDLTLGGTKLGTPSYMSPEQAIGEHTIGPSTDIYSLGAVLYEMLTGRPPFRAETPAETERQVIAEEPAPPSRLNAKVPRDLETICLKCLQKAASGRYRSAQDLADDLRRFLRHEPILARRIGRTARVLRWVRRKPTAAALVTTAVALVVLALGGGMRLVQQQAERRAELRTEVGTGVAQAVNLRRRFHFQEARALLEQARQRLEPAGLDDLRRYVIREQADLELVENLDTARLRAAVPAEGLSGPAGAELLYERALARAGLGGLEQDSAVVAERVRASSVRAEIVAALDDWAGTTEDESRRAWLLAVARAADPDPTRDRLREPRLWRDAPELTRLVRELRIDELSPQLLTALGRALRTSGGDAVTLLSAAQARYPQDFWLNFELGWALYNARRHEEALGFNRAALALRPEASSAYNSIGINLGAMGHRDEAVRYLQRALDIDPNSGTVHNNLALALVANGHMDEAIGHYEEAIRIDRGESPTAHYNLGIALWSEGKHDASIGHYQEAIRLDPRAPLPHYALGVALVSKGQDDAAIGQFEESIRLDPQASANPHYQLGRVLRSKGRLGEAIGHFEQSLRLKPDFVSAREDLCNCRYAAACAALRASTGQASRETPTPQEEQVRLRRQALDWLRATLQVKTEVLKEDKAAGWSVAAWQTDPALAGVREQEMLAKLSDTEREQWQALWADVAALLAAAPVEHAWAQIARRDWAGAADSYGRALSTGATDDGNRWFEYAAVLLLSGDRAGYERACVRMVERCGKAPELRTYHMARACTLAPDAGVEASLPGRLAESELMDSASQFWSLTEQGALHYRAGRFPEAVALFEQSLAADARPGCAVLNWLWLALANERLGKPEEARRWLDRATVWLDQFRDGMPSRAESELGLHLHNWLEAHVLRREAEAAIMAE